MIIILTKVFHGRVSAFALFCFLLNMSACSAAVSDRNTERESQQHSPIALATIKPNMVVENVNRTAGFYINVLNFRLISALAKENKQLLHTLPANEPLIFAHLKHQDIEILLQLKDDVAKDTPPTFKTVEQLKGHVTFLFDVDNLQEVYATIKEKVSVVRPPHKTAKGNKEFYIRDCNDEILAFREIKAKR